MTFMGLLVKKAPRAEPTMMRISVGCQSARILPPSSTNPPMTHATTTTEPMIVIT